MESSWRFEYKRPHIPYWEPSLLEYPLKEAVIKGKNFAEQFPMFEVRIRKGNKTIYHN